MHYKRAILFIIHTDSMLINNFANYFLLQKLLFFCLFVYFVISVYVVLAKFFSFILQTESTSPHNEENQDVVNQSACETSILQEYNNRQVYNNVVYPNDGTGGAGGYYYNSTATKETNGK